MELNITRTENKISFNFEELKQEITEKANLYKNIVYDESRIQEAKSDRAKLNKFKTALDTKRKEMKKECLKPYEEFEKQINELIKKIDEPINAIDMQTKAADKKRKKEKMLQISETFIGIGFPAWVELENILDVKWLNATTSLSAVKKAMEVLKEKIESDLAILQSTDCTFEATEIYKKTLDLKKSIEKAQEIKTINDLKKEVITEEEPQRTETVVIPAAEDNSPKEWVNIAVFVNNEQGNKVADFLIENGIEFKTI